MRRHESILITNLDSKLVCTVYAKPTRWKALRKVCTPGYELLKKSKRTCKFCLAHIGRICSPEVKKGMVILFLILFLSNHRVAEGFLSAAIFFGLIQQTLG